MFYLSSGPFMSKSNVKLIVKKLLVVRTDVNGDWQALHTIHKHKL